MIYKKAEGLEPCPKCGGTNIYWCGNYYVSLLCADCKFELYPDNEFAPENEYIDLWESYPH